MAQHFVAYASQDKIHAETIRSAALESTSALIEYRTWREKDASGAPLGGSVERWIADAEGMVADITFVNDNVTYEIGLAIGLGRPLRLIRNESIALDDLKAVGLLDTLLRDSFKTRNELVDVLTKSPAPANHWRPPHRNKEQPIFVLTPPTPTPFTTSLLSAVKKKARFKFRSFNNREISRLPALEAYDHAAASFGVIVTWQDTQSSDSRRNNQRAAFLFGIARGLEIPAILIAHDRSQLPSDISDLATRFTSENDLPEILRGFRDDVHDAINDYVEEPEFELALLDSVSCGDAAAENEQDHLRLYFIETEEFKKALDGQANLVIGRKGSGKSAICLQIRDRVRHSKRNIVVDLNPEGYQLLKLKELMLKLTTRGIRQEFVAVFWQYVLWLEIAYKILEKDQKSASRDGNHLERYERLQHAFQTRVDTGAGDFSERLRLLTDGIETRLFNHKAELSELKSSQVLEIVYGTDVAAIRDEVLSYLKQKGEVLFLFDNLDRMRAPGGFDQTDALMILGLVESLQDMTKRFRRQGYTFNWIVFIRSDVYQFVVREMTDYGKHAQQDLEWRDAILLKRILQKRILSSLQRPDSEWDRTWSTISAPTVNGVETLTFLINSCLMRPRYLIRLFETAKRRAINLDHQRILEDDYKAAVIDLGWDIMEDLNLELRDIVESADSLLFDLAHLNGACGIAELHDAVAVRVGATDLVKRVVNVLLWSGAIGLKAGSTTTFIYDCGYALPFLNTLMDKQPELEICLHPTLARLNEATSPSGSSS